MIDQKILRTDINEVTKLLLRKGYTLNIENWNKLEQKRAKIQVKNENQQAELNSISKEIGILKSQGDVNPSLEKEASKLSKFIKDRNKVLDSLLDEIKNFLLEYGSILFESKSISIFFKFNHRTINFAYVLTKEIRIDPITLEKPKIIM